MGNDLIGHSDCEIYLIGKNKLVKKSPSIEYNDYNYGESTRTLYSTLKNPK